MRLFWLKFNCVDLRFVNYLNGVNKPGSLDLFHAECIASDIPDRPRQAETIKQPAKAHCPVNLEPNEDESRYAVVRKLGGLFQIFVWRNIGGAD